MLSIIVLRQLRLRQHLRHEQSVIIDMCWPLCEAREATSPDSLEGGDEQVRTIDVACGLERSSVDLRKTVAILVLRSWAGLLAAKKLQGADGFYDTQ